MGKNNNMGTYTISAGQTRTIYAADGVYCMSLNLSAAGVATVQGAAVIGELGASSAISLDPSVPTIISNPDPIDNFVIVCTSGTVTIYTNQ